MLTKSGAKLLDFGLARSALGIGGAAGSTEMATARRAFEGKAKTSLIAAILSTQPLPISSVQPVMPPARGE